ncbi:unnamed protein product [Rotaria sp. Silwood1]|nr:unnamed protein product [Rotaria sp. Silwood1]CAF1064514.1 unnamed protein product [Rotaria sp. Silwood1]CAF4698867.1 unnamed protein product [Rotaria sp. Silwood1]CAF4792975.1 unnamed protein product [Rotaria sp. Silwood1]
MQVYFVCIISHSFLSTDIVCLRTNCTTSEECWREALVYRSSELIERLFSFSSLSLYIDTFQRRHSHELNDSILFVDNALENHLTNESIDSNLNINLFKTSKQLLIDLCTNLTSKPIETIDELPTLMCSLSTCSSSLTNFMILLIISILIASLILLICFVQSFQTYRRVRSSKIASPLVPASNPLAINNSSNNLHSSNALEL